MLNFFLIRGWYSSTIDDQMELVKEVQLNWSAQAYRLDVGLHYEKPSALSHRRVLRQRRLLQAYLPASRSSVDTDIIN